MKTITLFLIYIGTFMLFYLILSTIGLIFGNSYSEIISNGNWFMGYLLILGWWIPIFPTREYYLVHEDYFDNVF